MQCWVAFPIRTLLTVTGVREREVRRERHRWMWIVVGFRRGEDGLGGRFKEDFKGKTPLMLLEK